MKKRITFLSAVLLIVIIFTSTANPQVLAATRLYNRENAVAQMKSMARIYWTPKSNFSVLNKPTNKGGKYYGFTAGTKYYGMPYTWNTDKTLSQMTSLCSWNSTKTYRIFNNSGTFGNDCSTAVALAWQAGGAYMPANYDTATMLSKLKDGTSCIRKVGDYSTNGTDTQSIVTNNTKTKIKDCYALLKQGDACFHRDSAGAHAILIYSNNTATKKVKVIEQVGYWQSTYNAAGQQVQTTWFYLKEYDYDTLANKYYLPITNDVFINVDIFNAAS